LEKELNSTPAMVKNVVNIKVTTAAIKYVNILGLPSFFFISSGVCLFYSNTKFCHVSS
jgi:hypothetical protein